MKKGDYIIVRTYSAGVFAGNLEWRKGKEVMLKNARRFWSWNGANSLSQLAVDGTKDPANCKFPAAVSEILLTEAIELMATKKTAEKSIKAVPVWMR